MMDTYGFHKPDTGMHQAAKTMVWDWHTRTSEFMSKLNSEERSKFASSMYYFLGAFMSNMLAEVGGKQAQLPDHNPPAWVSEELNYMVGYPLMDHISKIKGTKDMRVSHSYGAGMTQFKQLIAECEERKLSFHVGADSVYFAGHTFAIYITKV